MDETKLRDILAQNMKALRSRRNWSQTDLAEKSGLSVVYLSDIERGNKWPYIDSFLKLASAFKVEPFELLRPETVQPLTEKTVLDKYSEELTAIMAKSFEVAEKSVMKSFASLRDKYSTQP
jgi:transcriptional regulator with XRE-family HTH domain